MKIATLGFGLLAGVAGASVLAAAGSTVTRVELPFVDIEPRDIGSCRAPTSYAGTSDVLTCGCPPVANDPNVSNSAWGTDVYTADSYICTTARHAGVIGDNGGQVTLQMLPGRASYEGMRRNGVQTRSFGRYGASYRYVSTANARGEITPSVPVDDTGDRMFNAVVDLPDFDLSMIYSASKKKGGVSGVLGSISRSSGNRTVRDVAGIGEAMLETSAAGKGQGAEDIGECKGASKWHDKPGKLLSCTCPASPSESSPIWGTAVYTGDSYICKAALHAGAIDRSGGRVAIQMMPDEQSYSASVHNGITSLPYGLTRRLGSYRFVK